jgi:phosphonate transport system substrate-binding protein
MDDRTYREMQKMLLGMPDDAEGRALLRQLNLDGFIVGDTKLYKRVEQVIRALGEK